MVKPSEHDIWLVLDGKASRSAEDVARWLSTAEGQKWILENTDKIIRHCEEVGSDAEVPTEEMLANIHKAIHKLIRRRRNRRIALVAASILLPIAFMTVMWININNRVGNVLFGNPQMVSETASLGERKVIVFQDGTKVYLNAGSEITYPSLWSLKSRDVVLEGEGFFDVVKNPKRPLVIDLDGASLAVYGTRFNVKAYPHEDIVDVVLFDGNVVFETEGEKYEIEPSDKLAYNRTTGKVDIISLKSTDDEILWTKNVIHFRNTPLKDISAVLSRWYNVTFEVENEEIYTRKFTLKTAHQPLHVLMEEMEYVSDLEFVLDGSVVKVRLKPNKE